MSDSSPIAVIVGIIITISVIRVLAEVIRLIALIVLFGIGAIALLGLITWAVMSWADRKAARQDHVAGPARQPCHPGASGPAQNHIRASSRTSRSWAASCRRQNKRIARQFADAVAANHDPSAIEGLIRDVLRGHDT